MTATLTKEQKKQFFKLSWPLFIEVFLGLLTGYITTFMFSRYSQSAAGIVNVSNQMITMFYLVFQVISTGTGILMAQSVGAKSAGIKEKIAAVSIFYAAIIGFIGTIIIVFFGQGILTSLNLDPAMIQWGTSFSIIIGSFFVLQSVSFVVAQIVYSYGHTKVGMIGTFVANIATLLINWALIFGVPALGIPSLGIVGAAIGSVIGRIIYFAFIFIFLRKKIKLSVSAKALKPFPNEVASKLFKVGVPATLENISYALSQLVIIGFIVALGTDTLSSKAYFETIAVATWAVSSAVGGSTAILVGQRMGARDKEGTHKIVQYSLKIALLSTIVPSLILVFTAGPLGLLFTHNADIIGMMEAVAIIDIFLQLGRGVNMVIGRALKTSGDAKYPLMLALVVNWLVMIPVGYFLCFTLGWGIVGIWIATASDEFIRGIFVLFRWKSRKWETKTLVKAEVASETNSLSQ